MLHVHRAERADALVEALAALLAAPPPDPLAPEVIAVPTRGMERWLTQRLSGTLGATPSRSDGICANVEFPFPRALAAGAVAAACGIAPDQDPWQPSRLVWPLLEVVDEHLGEPWLRRLCVYLGAASEPPDPVRHARRLTAVRHLAELYSRYALHRPQMLCSWAGGADTGSSGQPLGPDAAWQAQLWRSLRERIGAPSPAERLENACERLRAEPALAELPQRLSLFGLTRLPAGHLEVLRALAAARDVHLFLLHPSPALWRAVEAATKDAPAVERRAGDPTTDLAAHRLLASWGQDAREMQLVLAGGGDGIGDTLSHHHPVEHPGDSLLRRIQADVCANHPATAIAVPGGEDDRPLLERGDRSVQVHACHGRSRQVEVVRDAILHELQEDPTLEPRDVIVMCPDIETFAPLIEATFGAGEAVAPGEGEALPAGGRPVDLRVRLADRALRQTNPVLGVVAQLMDLVDGRLTASQVLDLADREPVRRRFRLDDEDLTRLQGWIVGSGIRWGLDADHRAPFKLDGVENGTWRKGLDRILTGVAMTEDEQRRFGGVLPLDDVESGRIDLAGRFGELVDRLQSALDSLATSRPIGEWAQAIAHAADALTDTTRRDSWQRAELQRLLDDILEEACVDGAVSPHELAPAEVRSLLAGRLEGRPTRANFRTGHLTICTLVPMRSVPHRVVCLLGLGDGAFPRKAPRDGDDLMLDDPHVGERDPRAEDRQQLLDALMAAGDRLIVAYTGADERTNLPQPPAVPVGELLDVIDATVRVEKGRPRDRVVVRHPLQPFDPRNFQHAALSHDRTWSFDPVTLGGARALTGPREEPGPFLPARLAPLAEEIVEVEDLVRFARHPVRAFLLRRLGIRTGDFSAEVEDHLPVELDNLEQWGVGQRLLDALLAGIDGRTALLAEIARGTLPPGVLGKPIVDEAFPVAEAIAGQAAAVLEDGSSPGSVDVRVQLPDGRSLGGTVPGVCGRVLREVTYSRVAAKHRLAAWVRLLALTAAHPEQPYTAATVGRRPSGQGVGIARIRPLAGDAAGRREQALQHLATLLDLHDRGMREPLPLYCLTSAAYAEAAFRGRTPEQASRAARKQWESDWDWDREDRDLEHQLVLGGVRTFDDVLAEPPRADEEGEGWQVTETSRLGRCARHMWDGLLSFEEVTSA